MSACGDSPRLKVIGVTDARFEIWFTSPDEVSVWLETDLEAEPGPKREVLETWVFAALAAGVIANLPKPLAKELCSRLEEFPDTTNDDDVSAVVDGFHLVLPRPERGRKGFEGTFRVKGDLPIARLKPRGFRLFGREVQTYSQTATLVVLHNLFHGFTRGSRVMLVHTAHALGGLGQLGAIGMMNHAHAANTALDRGVEAAEAAAP